MIQILAYFVIPLSLPLDLKRNLVRYTEIIYEDKTKRGIFNCFATMHYKVS